MSQRELHRDGVGLGHQGDEYPEKAGNIVGKQEERAVKAVGAKLRDNLAVEPTLPADMEALLRKLAANEPTTSKPIKGGK